MIFWRFRRGASELAAQRKAGQQKLVGFLVSCQNYSA